MMEYWDTFVLVVAVGYFLNLMLTTLGIIHALICMGVYGVKDIGLTLNKIPKLSFTKEVVYFFIPFYSAFLDYIFITDFTLNLDKGFHYKYIEADMKVDKYRIWKRWK